MNHHKLTNMLRLILFFLGMGLFISCSSKNDQNKTEVSKNKPSENAALTQTIPQEILQRGEEVYNKHCLACHQTDGSGNPGMYPPLDNTETVNGDKEKLISIVLNGLTGEIEVKGEIYNQIMVPHNFLSDQQIADLLTYVRNSFGNSSAMITEKEVARVREKSR